MTSRLERITQQRKEKLDRIRSRGINPYPHRYHRSHTTQQAIALLEQHGAAEEMVSTKTLVDSNPAVSVAGRITARRNMGKISFLDLHDGSGGVVKVTPLPVHQ